MKIAGIDNGISGGIAVITCEGKIKSLVVFDNPIITTKKSIKKRDTGKRVAKIKNELDGIAITKIFKKYKPDFAFLEYAQSMPQQSAQSTFNTGEGYGRFRGIMEALNIKFEKVYSRTWQREFFPEKAFTRLSKEEKKKMSKKEIAKHKREVKKLICELSYKNAKRLFPNNAKDFGYQSSRTDSIIIKDGLSDATLIAEYGLRKYKEQEGTW